MQGYKGKLFRTFFSANTYYLWIVRCKTAVKILWSGFFYRHGGLYACLLGVDVYKLLRGPKCVFAVCVYRVKYQKVGAGAGLHTPGTWGHQDGWPVFRHTGAFQTCTVAECPAWHWSTLWSLPPPHSPHTPWARSKRYTINMIFNWRVFTLEFKFPVSLKWHCSEALCHHLQWAEELLGLYSVTVGALSMVNCFQWKPVLSAISTSNCWWEWGYFIVPSFKAFK